MTGVEPIAYLAVRILTSTSWIAAGIHASFNFEHTTRVMAGRGVPWQKQLLPIVILMEFVGAAMMLADLYTWAACLVWIAFLFLATPVYHTKWWTATPKKEFDFFQYTQFWKNVSMVGGLIAVILLDHSRPDWLLRG